MSEGIREYRCPKCNSVSIGVLCMDVWSSRLQDWCRAPYNYYSESFRCGGCGWTGCDEDDLVKVLVKEERDE